MLLGNVILEPAGTAHAGGGKRYDYNEAGLKKRFRKKGKGRQLSEMQFTRASQVQVQIPLTGKQYTFGSYLIKDFTPEVSIYYIDNTMQNLFSIRGTGRILVVAI